MVLNSVGRGFEGSVCGFLMSTDGTSEEIVDVMRWSWGSDHGHLGSISRRSRVNLDGIRVNFGINSMGVER